MVQLSSVISDIRNSRKGEPTEIVGAYAGIGNIFGIIAAVVGLFAGISLVPLTALEWVVSSETPFELLIEGSSTYALLLVLFMGLMTIGLLFQAFGSRQLRGKIGTMFGNVFYVGFLAAAFITLYVLFFYGTMYYTAQVPTFLMITYFSGAIFVISWQLISVFVLDTSKSWIGFLAGMLNGMFIPILALGQVLGPILIYSAYIVLIAGQLMSILYWWSSNTIIREYARSPDKAKFAFGISGILTFVIGLAAVFVGASDGELFYPWNTMVSNSRYLTDPSLVYALLSAMVFWIFLSPRLGAKELKSATIGDDIIKGSGKWFSIFLMILGIIAAGQGGNFWSTAGFWAFFIIIAPAGAMIFIGTLYASKTDIITGLPLIVAGLLIMVNPYTLFSLVLVAWILIIITQAFLAIECKFRGLTYFSQGFLTVLFTILSSIAIIIIMLGGFGSGPLALWPTNRWFNITMIPGVDAVIQSPLIIILPFILLIVRNTSLVGISYGRGYSTGGILLGMTTLFSLMIPIIAGNFTVTHEANTGAALMLALYSISVVLIMSISLNLSDEVENTGHVFEGTFIRVSSIIQVIAAAIVALMVLYFFGGLPSPSQIAFVISVFVAFVVSTEVLSIIGWLIIGLRLGILKQGFRFQRTSE